MYVIYLGICFFILLPITIFYLKTKQYFGLIFVSFAQGVIISILFSQLINAFAYAFFYYILFKYMWNLVFLLSNSRKTEKYENKELLAYIEKNQNLRNLKIELRKYSGKGSLNAVTIPTLKKGYQIAFGEELIQILNAKEKIIVLAHELSHILRKHILKKSIAIFLSFILLVVISQILSKFSIHYFAKFSTYMATFSFFIIALCFFVLTIIVFNIVSRYIEYSADKNAVQMTNDLESFENAFSKIEKRLKHKNYKIQLFNLIIYDHPFPSERLRKIREYYKG